MAERNLLWLLLGFVNLSASRFKEHFRRLWSFAFPRKMKCCLARSMFQASFPSSQIGRAKIIEGVPDVRAIWFTGLPLLTHSAGHMSSGKRCATSRGTRIDLRKTLRRHSRNVKLHLRCVKDLYCEIYLNGWSIAIPDCNSSCSTQQRYPLHVFRLFSDNLLQELHTPTDSDFWNIKAFHHSGRTISRPQKYKIRINKVLAFRHGLKDFWYLTLHTTAPPWCKNIRTMWRKCIF